MNGTGDGNVNGVVQFNALREANRPALSLVNGTVYRRVGLARRQRPLPRLGGLLGRQQSAKPRAWCLSGVLNTDPNGGGAGIWGGGGGLTFEPDGSAFYFRDRQRLRPRQQLRRSMPTASPPTAIIYESLVKVVADPTTTATSQNPNGWGLKIADYFTPFNVIGSRQRRRRLRLRLAA